MDPNRRAAGIRGKTGGKSITGIKKKRGSTGEPRFIISVQCEMDCGIQLTNFWNNKEIISVTLYFLYVCGRMMIAKLKRKSEILSFKREST
jgi:hypothetical protein